MRTEIKIKEFTPIKGDTFKRPTIGNALFEVLEVYQNNRGRTIVKAQRIDTGRKMAMYPAAGDIYYKNI
jgi:hypothetical protein